ncbi:MAG: hypothetical protein OXH51_13990 [Gemmatimonadetes bacterium]|nr:hypothetical protein [Gemmatimonadota bacterium]MCY3612636.1 hypothetical protein [Gemmatimonadota bacterium]MCY3679299.1 hypothetical protein [Gemmatimonadota bacterium]MYA43596.1 hypothetical protein [Gemmatimonadota bacterium]MYE92676.1 hypothetical protein [Gemmatimonadota bacterium]
MIIETLVGGTVGALGHVKCKEFVRRKLRYTKVAEKSASGMGLAAGAATAIVATPLVGLVPFVGLGWGTAALIGLGVGSGVGFGIKKARGE